MRDGLLSIPVFPLPRVVLFPGAALPLHVFEPRYRAMVRDAMAGRAELAMVLLKPGYEADYFGSPQVHDVGCLGSLQRVRSLPDGRFLLELVGLSRVEFVSWEQLTPYRIARCRAAPEREPDPDSAEAKDTLLKLSATFQALLQEMAGTTGPLRMETPAEEATGFAKTVNRICFALDIEPEEKQRLLMEDDLLARGRQAGEHLDSSLRKIARMRPASGREPVN